MLGFLLEDDATLRDDIVDSALARPPVIGAQLGDNVQPLAGSGVGLAVGLAGALWAGLGVALALGRALNAIWDVPRLEQRGPLGARVRALAVLLALGAVLVATSLAGGVAAAGSLGPAAERASVLAATLMLNGLVLLGAFLLLTARPHRARDHLPGVALAAGAWLVLQAAGGWYVDHVVSGASATYGTFALVIGLLSWFWLASHVLLCAAELNVVLLRQLWPRSLSGDLEPADRLAMRRHADAVRQDPRQRISVSFSDES